MASTPTPAVLRPSSRLRRLRLPLALGATALGTGAAALLGSAPSERAQAANLFGSQPIAAGQAIALAQPLAVVALGLGRRTGFGARVDAEVHGNHIHRHVSDQGHPATIDQYRRAATEMP